MEVRNFIPGDESDICDIYNYYVTDTVITFEEIPLTAHKMRERIDSYLVNFPWLVCEHGGEITGFAYASKFHSRSAYKHTVEVTVYVRKGFGRHGAGKALYGALLPELAQLDCHIALAAIALPNQASVGLHEACGFTKVGHLGEVGRKFDQWVDVGYWQRQIG